MIFGGIIPELEGYNGFIYSYPFIPTGITTLIFIVYEEGYFDFLATFNETVWIVLIFTVLFCGLAYWIYEKDSKTKYDFRLSGLENFLMALFNTFELIFSVIEKPIKTISTRILITGFFMLIAIVSNYYVGHHIRRIEGQISKKLIISISYVF